MNPANTKPIDHAFAQTTQLLFGKDFSPVEDYGEWLLKRIPHFEVCASSITGKKIIIPDYSVFQFIPKNKAAGLDSLEELSKRQIEIKENDTVSTLSEKLKVISVYIAEFVEGQNQDVTDSAIYNNLSTAYKIVDCFNSKYLAYSFFNDDCEYIFGTSRCFDSQFCIHAYNSRKISMCFEVDACKDCSQLMFSHNCQSVHESIFYFNAKNLRYAVCNHVVGREKYLKVKNMVVDYVLENMKKKKSLD